MKRPYIREFFEQIRGLPVQMGQDAARAATRHQSGAILGQHLRALRENKYVSVMAGGVPRNGRKFFVIIVWDGRLRLFDVPVLAEEDHVAIAAAVARVVRMLRAVGVRIIAIVADNAGPNVRAFDEA
jgi:hypothetical protein